MIHFKIFALGFVVAFLLLFTLVVYASTACDQASSEALLSCNEQQLEQLEVKRAILAQQVSELFEILEPREHLKQAESSWEAYRENQCEMESYLAKGLYMPRFVELGCKMSLTEQRIKELEETLNSKTLY